MFYRLCCCQLANQSYWKKKASAHRNSLAHGDFQPRFCEHLSDAVGNYIQAQGLAKTDIDVLVTSQIASGFPNQLADACGLSESAIVVDIHSDFGDPHTAAPMVCLQQLQCSGRLQPGSTILFALVGSGIATTCAIYRVPS